MADKNKKYFFMSSDHEKWLNKAVEEWDKKLEDKLFSVATKEIKDSDNLASWDIETPNYFNTSSKVNQFIYYSNPISASPDNIKIMPVGTISFPAEKKPSMWSLTEARLFIGGLQEWSREFNYHVCLGGSVLNSSKSTKDLDLYFLPLNNGTVPQPSKLLKKLQIKLEAPLEQFNAEYPEKSMPYIFKGKMLLKGKKRIDFFMMGSNEDLANLQKGGWQIPKHLWEKDSVEIESSNIVHFKKPGK